MEPASRPRLAPAAANLLRGRWTTNRLRRIFADCPRRPLLPPLGDPRWGRAAANPNAAGLIAPLIHRARDEWNRPLPRLTKSRYSLYRRTGERLPFEKPYFERRRLLARAAIALLLARPDDPWRDRLRRSVVAKLQGIFDEPSWAVPAHVASASGQDRGRIDLFCAETANLMAEALDLFGKIVPPPLRRRIRARLRRDVWENYRNDPLSHNWYLGSMNWTAVCHQGVLGSALSQEESAERLADLVLAARRGLRCFLGGFGKDGGTSEGPLYWGYGFGWFAALNEQLEARTGGRLSLFAGDPHVRRIARFGPILSLRKEKLVNFADGMPERLLNPGLLAYLGDRLEEGTCRAQASANYARLFRTGLDLDDQRADLFFLARLLLRCPERADEAAPAAPDHFFRDLGVVVARGRDRRGRVWEFAAKAGHNEEHHNHNDCGAWLLNIDGARYVAEIGAPEYDRGYFGPQRYGYLAARTLGHSLPILNGQEQAAGRSHAARVVECSLGKTEVLFRVDATRCYPASAGCRRFLREFRFHKDRGGVDVVDSLEMSRLENVEGGLISSAPVSLSGSDAWIEAEAGPLRVRPFPGTKLDRVEIHAYRTHQGGDAHAYRLVMRPSSPRPRLRLGVALRLA